MERLKRLIREIHRRSLWQVLAIYVAASWIVFEVVQTVTEGLGLPEWFPAFAALLLLIGLPVVLATAFVQEGMAPARGSDPTLIPTSGTGPAAGSDGGAGDGGRRLLTWRNAIAGGVLALALWGAVAAGWALFGPDRRSAEGSAAAEAGPKAIAVLPFDNMSGDSEDEYFTDGIHDEIITHLAKIDDLKVISRTSVLEYDGSPKNVRTIADELGVGFVLEGGVRRYGDRVRITAQLIDGGTDEHLWAETYERTWADLFAVQAEVAERIAGSLDARLTPEQRERIADRPTENLEAYEYYLRGRDHQGLGERADLEAAVEMYRNAVERDPGFALAWARLSTVHTWTYFFGYDRSPDRLERAERAAETALELDPDLAEAHLALAWYHYHGHRNYERALEEAARAEEQGLGGRSELFLLRGAVQRRRGDLEAAITSWSRALELDPRNQLLTFNLGETYTGIGRYAEADRYFERAIDLEPARPAGYVLRAWNYIAWNGRLDEARRTVESGIQNADTQYVSLQETAYWIELYDGEPEAALRHLRRIEDEWIYQQQGDVPKAYYAAKAYREMGGIERARAHFDTARALLETRLEAQPENASVHRYLALVHAYLGQKEQAIRLGQKAVDLMPISRDYTWGIIFLWDLARVHAIVGEHEQALDALEYLLSIPYTPSFTTLGLDPVWDPLREEPGFRTLLEKHGRV